MDDDRRQCRDAPYQTINAAVAAADPGDRVLVCPGAYNEDVPVDKAGLHLEALSDPSADAYRADCFDPAPSDPTRDAIIEGLVPAFMIVGFDLRADDIEVEGFVFEDHDNAGVFTHDTASGYFVHDNLFQDYLNAGINFNSGGAKRSVVSENCFRLTGARRFSRGFRSDLKLRNGLIDRNKFFNNGETGMALGPGVVDVTISHNLGIRETTLLQVGASRGVRVLANTSLDNDPAAFFGVFTFSGGNRGTLIAGNRVRGGSSGIRFDRAIALFEPNTGLRVLGNHIAGMSGSGIHAPFDFTNEPVVVDSTFVANSSGSNRVDGIRFELATAAGNLVARNGLRRNGEHDCHDDTVGAGTAGTANIWRDNDAQTENRPGLCRPHAQP